MQYIYIYFFFAVMFEWKFKYSIKIYTDKINLTSKRM